MFKKQSKDIVTFTSPVWYEDDRYLDEDLKSIQERLKSLENFKRRIEEYLKIDINCIPEVIRYEKVKKGKKIFIPPQFWNSI
jgi:hypothetical protein